MKRNLILLVIVAVIAGIFFWDQKRTEKIEETEQTEKRITTLKSADVQSITLRSRHFTIRGEKENGQWKLVDPLEAPGDQTAWSSIVNTMTSGERQRVIEENPSDIAKFGFDEPPMVITLSGGDESESTTIVFGKESPVSGKHFALIRDTSEVITLYSNAFTTVNKNLFDLRDKTVIEVTPADVQRVQIAHEKLDITLDRRGENWVITQPIQARADGTKVQEFISQINNLRVKQFIEEKPEIYDAYGLVHPATQVVLLTGESGESSLASRGLLLGATNEHQNVYAKLLNQDHVFAISAVRDLNKIPLSLEELRMTKVTPLRSWEVNQFILTAPGMVVEASKTLGEWHVLQPEGNKADYNTVADLVRSIVDLEVAEYIQGSTEQYSIDQPFLSIQLLSDSTSDTIQIAQGPNGEFFGIKTNPTEIYTISSEAIQGLLTQGRRIQVYPNEVPSTFGGEIQIPSEAMQEQTMQEQPMQLQPAPDTVDQQILPPPIHEDANLNDTVVPPINDSEELPQPSPDENSAPEQADNTVPIESETNESVESASP